MTLRHDSLRPEPPAAEADPSAEAGAVPDAVIEGGQRRSLAWWRLRTWKKDLDLLARLRDGLRALPDEPDSPEGMTEAGGPEADGGPDASDRAEASDRLQGRHRVAASTRLEPRPPPGSDDETPDGEPDDPAAAAPDVAGQSEARQPEAGQP
jgi:hypothetical protein